MTTPRSRALVLACVSVVAAVSACGGGGDTTTSPGASGAAQAASSALAAPGSPAAVPLDGPLLADNGFRPDKNGLPFENYGVGPSLTEADVRTLFGDAVCASTDNGGCLLTEQAKAWRAGMNKAMEGGHCFGFSVLALQLFKGSLKPSDIGGSSVTGLTMGNAAVTSRLSIDWTYQTLPSVRAGTITGTPNDILDRLLSYLKDPAPADSYTVAIFSDKGGHAITPFAAVDRGNNKVGILVYDNNFPGVPREMTFDRSADTFQYNSAANPSAPPEIYSTEVRLYPTRPGEAVQPCPFCGAPAGGATSRVPGTTSLAGYRVAADATPAPGDRYYQVFLDGTDAANHAHLVFTDEAGHRTGLVDGTMHSEVPGVTPVRTTFDEFSEASEPIYQVAVGTRLTITVDGTALTAPDSETLDIVGPGVDAQLSGVTLAPGEHDTVALSADGTALVYATAKAETPTLELARQDANADWAADLTVHGGEGGATLAVSLTDQALTVGATDDTAATYDVVVTREDAAGAAVFKHSGLALAKGAVAGLDYTRFTKHGDAIPASIQSGGTTQPQQLEDQGP